MEIEIFPISKTQVDRQEVQRWLNYLNVSDEYKLPDEAIVSDRALNIALAAKRCYMSFEPGLNPNVNKVRTDWAEYLDNVLKSGHGCYDDKTDVFTKRGWVNWKNVKDDDEFYTTDEVTKSLRWSKAKEIIRAAYEGDMYHFISENTDLLVTPNHNMFVAVDEDDGKTYEKFMKAYELYERIVNPKNKQTLHFSPASTIAKKCDNYKGNVYCAVLPDDTSHLLYVRRNGKEAWCGNSVLEHSSYTFAIEGVTRVFTAEMNRHRAGWAISEGSLRYIRFDEEIPFWMPMSIRDNQEDDKTTLAKKKATRGLFQKAFTNQHQIYQQLCDIWDVDTHPFSFKKKMTSLFRRIIGMGVSTGGIWTGNIRALRHVLTMRCSEHAEEEICHVFSRVAKMLVEEEPMLFGDFEKTNGFWVPKYLKV